MITTRVRRNVAGTVSCWGWDLYGELGNDAGGASGSPIAVAGLTGVTKLTAEDFDSCALLVSATVTCWGYNGLGELGDGTRHDFGRAGPGVEPRRRDRRSP